MLKLLIIIFIFFSFVFVSYAIMVPELVVNDNLKQCEIVPGEWFDKYKLIDGWRRDRYEDWQNYEKRCDELGYTFANSTNTIGAIRPSYIASKVVLILNYISFVFFSILAYKKFIKKEYETSCCIIPVMIFFIFLLSMLFCFFVFE